LGSTTGLTDSNGVVTESASYDSFGRTISSNLTTRYQYTGREYDEYTGLMFYRARFYDPQSGRFISEDPIGFKGGVNWYGYVKNNPIIFRDPSGRSAAGAIVIGYGIWTGACVYAAIQKGKELEAQGRLKNDKQKHCFVACYYNRCKLLSAPDETFLGGVIWEVLGWAEDSVRDIEANAYGIAKSYTFASCETSCASCEIQ